MLGMVDFRPEDYGPDIAHILEPAGGGKRLMPLVKPRGFSPEAIEGVKRLKSPPPSVVPGLYLYLGCWDAAHSAADSIENADGYFWHAILHRQEPDAGNAAYWFRKTGRHPIFPMLAAEAEAAGYAASREWNPLAFVEFCESARGESLVRQPEREQVARQVQLIEWQLLFNYCARGQNC
jgi:hypothetical protein